MDWNRILPVIVSIIIIISIAVLRQYSRTLAAVASVMPINIPLGMWIVYAGEQGNRQKALAEFSAAMVPGIIPTLIFLLVVWQTTRIGWELLPSIGIGYLAWAIGLGVVLLVRG